MLTIDRKIILCTSSTIRTYNEIINSQFKVKRWICNTMKKARGNPKIVARMKKDTGNSSLSTASRSMGEKANDL